MSEQEKLLPCPLCGSDPVFANVPGDYQIYCEDCGCADISADTQAQAYTVWNTRPQPAPDSELAKRLNNYKLDLLVFMSDDYDDANQVLEDFVKIEAAIAAMQPAIDKARADAKAEERARCVAVCRNISTNLFEASSDKAAADFLIKAIEQGGA